MIAAALDRLTHDISVHSADLGKRVAFDPARVLDRSDSLALSTPGSVSSNGSCRLLAAADGWLALNLARPEDREALPAWLCCDVDVEDGDAIAAMVAAGSVSDLLKQGRLLSLPVAAVGEIAVGSIEPPCVRIGAGGEPPQRLRVLDLSALWAGPLCASVFAEMGADVLRLESAERAENTSSPHYRRLNDAKNIETIAWNKPAEHLRLREELAHADVIISSARARAFVQLSFDPFAVLQSHAVWVAVSGYGWSGEHVDRIAFGDDAAAAAGLVTWGGDGAPRFLGDALADPITGLAAAAAALRAVAQGGGVFIDAALAHCAAGARAMP